MPVRKILITKLVLIPYVQAYVITLYVANNLLLNPANVASKEAQPWLAPTGENFEFLPFG